VKEYGLWLEDGTESKPLSDAEIGELEKIVKQSGGKQE
jgi:hypothetical protein